MSIWVSVLCLIPLTASLAAACEEPSNVSEVSGGTTLRQAWLL